MAYGHIGERVGRGGSFEPTAAEIVWERNGREWPPVAQQPQGGAGEVEQPKGLQFMPDTLAGASAMKGAGVECQL